MYEGAVGLKMKFKIYNLNDTIGLIFARGD